MIIYIETHDSLWNKYLLGYQLLNSRLAIAENPVIAYMTMLLVNTAKNDGHKFQSFPWNNRPNLDYIVSESYANPVIARISYYFAFVSNL